MTDPVFDAASPLLRRQSMPDRHQLAAETQEVVRLKNVIQALTPHSTKGPEE